LIYQKGQLAGNVTGECDMGGNIQVQGVAVIPRVGSGNSTFKQIDSTHLDSNKLIIALC
jgi:hypothetical protein